jgi:hypothetical protein
MSKLAEIPLESYLLAQHAAPLECLICGHENCRSTERCRHCSVPMALAHQSLRLKQKPQLIAVLGAAGVGKTTYLGMLMDMLSRQVGMLRTTARGPLSISLQQATTTALSNGWFPEKTECSPERWHWVHCQFHCRRRRRPLDLVIPDISGDALLEETERSGRHAAIRALLGNCAGVVVIADAERLQTGDHSQDFVTMKLVSLMTQLREEKNKRGRLPRGRDRRPLALVLTKADACPSCSEDPLEFAEAHASTLLRDCQSRFLNTRVFAASVVGACAYREMYGIKQRVPLRIEPHGVVEPFGWLLTQL